MEQAPDHVASGSVGVLTETVFASGIPVHCAHDELADVDVLVPNPRNPNRHSEEQIRLLSKIIRHQGWRAPITISNRSGFVVRGHGRLQAARLLGVDLVPVDCQDYASEAEEWADLIADNRLSELSEMDNPTLRELLQELDSGMLQVLGADMEITGFTDAALAELMAQFEPEEEPQEVEAPEPPAQPVTRPGDLWLLGRVARCPRCGRLTDV
jgi:hypothetical protein